MDELYTPNKKQIAEEQILKRPLYEGEYIAFINGDKTDLRAENILVFRTQSDVGRFYQTGIYEKLDDNTCISPKQPHMCVCNYCNKTFESKVKNAKYCSRKCFTKSNVKEIPRKRDLKNTLLKDMTLTEIAKYYNISYQTLLIWLEKRNLPCTKKEIKQLRKEAYEQQFKNEYFPNKKKNMKIQNKYNEYTDCPVKLSGYYIHTKEFPNIYRAADYVIRNRWTDVSKDTIISCIQRVILGKRQSYLNCKWESPLLVERNQQKKEKRKNRNKGDDNGTETRKHELWNEEKETSTNETLNEKT